MPVPSTMPAWTPDQITAWATVATVIVAAVALVVSAVVTGRATDRTIKASAAEAKRTMRASVSAANRQHKIDALKSTVIDFISVVNTSRYFYRDDRVDPHAPWPSQEEARRESGKLVHLRNALYAWA